MSKYTDYINSLTDNKCDPHLGCRVRERMEACGLEQVTKPEFYNPEAAETAFRAGIANGFSYLGLDVDDPSLKDTPRRFAAMVVGELTKGLNYDFFPKCTATPNGKEIGDGETPATAIEWVGKHDQMVLVKDISVISLCEHHLQTIDGICHIAYIPKDKVLGLSKFARVADFFARRPQIQERMTDQIYEAFRLILETDDIAVVVDATHFCMKARGAMQHSSRTQTNKMGGNFMSQPSLRQEFLDAIR